MDIEREVAELIKRVAALEAAVMPAAIAPPAPIAPPTPGPVFLPAVPPGAAPVAYPPPTTAPMAYPPRPRPEDAVAAGQPPTLEQAAFEWGIEAMLRWAGVVLVTLAGIFLVSTAISRGWIGPELQLLGAALGGVALLGGAVHLSESRRPWALALGCGGSVVLAASALATHEWLDLVGPGVALALFAATTVVSIAVALELRLEGIALTAGVVAMLAALDTLDNLGDGATLVWVATCIIGSSVLGLAKTWPRVRLVSGWLGAAILLLYAIAHDVDGSLQAMGFVGAAVIACTLWAGPIVAHKRAPASVTGSFEGSSWHALDYRLAAAVPAWTWAVVVGLLSPIAGPDAGLIAMTLALGFLGLAAAGWRHVQRLVSISTILGSLALLALGFAMYLEGPALMVALAGQAVTSYYLGIRLDDKMLRYAGVAAGLLSSALAVTEMLDALDNDRFASLGAGLSTLLIVGGWVGATVVLYRQDQHANTFEPPFVGAWAGVMLWLAAALIGAPQGLVVISISWAIMACAGLVLGLTGRNSMVRNIAMGTLGITLFKLVSVDMSEVDVFWRVGLFFVVGMGLIALGLKVPALIAPPETDIDDNGSAAPPMFK